MKPIAAHYLALLPALRAAARRHDYALGLHGSVERDFDLIAVPWTVHAPPAAALVAAIVSACGGQLLPPEDGGDWPRQKPHGRLCWAIHLSGGMYIDLSVMPRTDYFVGEVPGDGVPVQWQNS